MTQRKTLMTGEPIGKCSCNTSIGSTTPFLCPVHGTDGGLSGFVRKTLGEPISERSCSCYISCDPSISTTTPFLCPVHGTGKSDTLDNLFISFEGPEGPSLSTPLATHSRDYLAGLNAGYREGVEAALALLGAR